MAVVQKNYQEHLLGVEKINETSRKMLELALESLEKPDLSEKKLKVFFKSQIFISNERDLFGEIKQNEFLGNCYYKTRLGLNPTLVSIKKLPDFAIEHIPEWGESSEDSVYSKKVLRHYEAYQAELKAAQKLREEEWKKSEKNRKKLEAKKEKEDLILKQKQEEESKKYAIQQQKAAEEYNKQAPIRFFKKILNIFIIIIGIILVLYVAVKALGFIVSVGPWWLSILILVGGPICLLFYIIHKWT